MNLFHKLLELFFAFVDSFLSDKGDCFLVGSEVRKEEGKNGLGKEPILNSFTVLVHWVSNYVKGHVILFYFFL